MVFIISTIAGSLVSLHIYLFGLVIHFCVAHQKQPTHLFVNVVIKNYNNCCRCSFFLMTLQFSTVCSSIWRIAVLCNLNPVLLVSSFKVSSFWTLFEFTLKFTLEAFFNLFRIPLDFYCSHLYSFQGIWNWI